MMFATDFDAQYFFSLTTVNVGVVVLLKYRNSVEYVQDARCRSGDRQQRNSVLKVKFDGNVS